MNELISISCTEMLSTITKFTLEKTKKIVFRNINFLFFIRSNLNLLWNDISKVLRGLKLLYLLFESMTWILTWKFVLPIFRNTTCGWLYELCCKSSQDGCVNSQSIKCSNLNSFSFNILQLFTFKSFIIWIRLSLSKNLFMKRYVEYSSILHTSEK